MIKKYCKGRYGSFKQIYEIPRNIQIDKITYRYFDNHLQINLPRKQERNNYFQNYGFNPFNGFW